MKRKQLLLAIAAMLLPLSMMAQTYHYTTVEVNGVELEYLYEDGTDPTKDENLFIWVAGTGSVTATDENGSNSKTFNNEYFFKDGNFRYHFRNQLNSNASKFYKGALGGIDDIDLTTWTNTVATYKGIEYFTQLKTFKMNSKNASASNVVADFSKNTLLETLNLNDANFGSGSTGTLNISNTKITSLTIPTTNTAGSLEILKANNSALTTLTIPAGSVLKTLEANNSALETLTITGSAGTLESLEINVPTLTSLTFGGYSDFTKLKNLDVSQTGLTSLDLSLCTVLASVKIDKTKLVPGTNLTLPDASGWIRLGAEGDVETWIYAKNSEVLTIDMTGATDTRVDVSDFRFLHTLTVIGATEVTLPNSANTTDHFTLTMTGCANAIVHWNGREDKLVTLTLNDVESFNGAGFTSLTDLTHTGSQSKNLTLVAVDNDALTKLDVSKSGLKKLDLSGGGTSETCIAKNLSDFNCCWSDLKYLDLSYHIKLTNRNSYGDNMLKIVPPYEGNSEGGPTGTNYFNGGYDIPNSQAGIDAYHSKDSLSVLKLRGCTGLGASGLVVPGKGASVEGNSNLWLSSRLVGGNPVIMSKLDTLDLSGCTNVMRLECRNTLLRKLNLTGCTNLKVISINQGRLTGKNDFNLYGCDNLTGLIAHRHKWETLDSLLTRHPDKIKMLTQIQVNGGSYTMYGHGHVANDHSANDKRYVREVYNEDTQQMEKMKYTCRLRELDLTNVKEGTFTKLFCEDNLLTTLNLGEAAASLTALQCRNNLLTTLDLSNLNHESLQDGTYSSRWSPQVGFVPVEIVKGGDGHPEIHGGHDWIALHMENGGYSHQLDNNVGLYHNVYDVMNSGTSISTAGNPWMCTVEQANGIPAFAGDYLCPTGHDGQHVFLESQAHIHSELGGYKDRDLYGKVLTYKYNTGYNQGKVMNDISGVMDKPSGSYINSVYGKTGASEYDEHIEVRMHIWPHIININPATKNPESVAAGVTFYSSTLCLDYDAIIPNGVEVYFVDSLRAPNRVTRAVGKYSSIPDNKKTGQFVMKKFGGAGDILPAHTPVFVKADTDAGLFAFQDAREFVLKGWENLRGDNEDEDHILHGVENNTERAIKSGYEDKYNDAITKKATMMTVETMDLDLDGNGIIEGEEANRIVKRGNILTGIVGERSSALSINDSDYNKWVREDSTLTSGVRTALTLGLQTDKYNTKIIGFWPYNGTNLSRNRCAILEYDYDNALYFAKQKEKEDEEAGSGEALSSSSKGGIFFFVIDDAIAGSVNGDTRVDEVDAQQILEVSTGSMKVGELAIPEAVDVPGGNPKAYEVNAQIVLDYSVTSEKPW